MKTQKYKSARKSEEPEKNKIRMIFSSHKWMLLAFFMVLFRAPLMKAVQKQLIPLCGRMYNERVCGKTTSGSAGRTSPMIASVQGSFRPEDDSGDDGCGDDEGCETEDDNEYYGTESSGDGCSDDDGCYEDESDDTYYYSQSDESDGCYCDGGAAVSSNGGAPLTFYNAELVIKVNLSQLNKISIKITDMYDYPKSVIQTEVILNSGNYIYRWDGRENNIMIPYGAYRAVLCMNGPVLSYTSKSFSYNYEHGFEVNGTQSNVIVFSY